MPTRLLTTTEVAARLDISRPRVLQLIAAGKLKAIRQGRDWFVAEKEVQAYVPPVIGWRRGRPRPLQRRGGPKARKGAPLEPEKKQDTPQK